MSRSGYSECDSHWQAIKWRGQVASATRGKRGQTLLIELRDALDAMPIKKLIKDELVTESGEFCALGVLGAKKGLDMKELDPDEPQQIGEAFDISHVLASEIVYENDESDWRETPEDRWKRMRWWVDMQIIQKRDKPHWRLTKHSPPPYYGALNIQTSDDGINVRDYRAFYVPHIEREAGLYGGMGNMNRAFVTDMGHVLPAPMFWRPISDERI